MSRGDSRSWQAIRSCPEPGARLMLERMSDRAQWKVTGPVRRLQTALAEWNTHDEAWGELRVFAVATFRPDGRLSETEHYNPDGSVARSTCVYDEVGRLVETRFRTGDGAVTRTVHAYDGQRLVRTVTVDERGESREREEYRYDDAGRKTRIQRLDPSEPNTCYGIDGSDRCYGAPGAVNLTVEYDEHDRPVEALFRDDAAAVVRRITFTRDDAGRLLREEVRFGDASPFPLPAAASGSTDDRARFDALMASTFGGGVFATVSYTYDDHSRVVDRVERMGQLSESRTTFRYDARDNPIEQIEETHRRQIGLGESGEPRSTDEASIEHRNLLEYVYDAQGNWTERVVSYRHGSTGHWQRSNIERREIVYDP
jgi:hypothetical protein